MIKTIIKRDGRREDFSAQKLNDWGIWAAKDLDPKIVNWSGVIMKVVSTLPEEVTAKQLMDALVKDCVNRDTFEHQKMAGRLFASSLPKEFYSSREYPTIKDLHKEMIEVGLIAKPNYSASEYKKIERMLRHDLDLTYAYYSLHQVVTRYAMRDKVSGKTYETPQFVYMRVAMQAYNNYKEADRMFRLKEMYDLLAERKINIPTPYFSNSLTSNPNVASCSVATTKDEAESIGVLNALMYQLTCQGAGLGTHSMIRSLGDSVRGGSIIHEGIVPYLKMFGATIKSSKQGCYDIFTEILTKDGWKYFADLTNDDLVAQVDDGLQVSYVKPLRVLAYPYEGEMINYGFKNGSYVSLVVTPNHQMLYKNVFSKKGEKMFDGGKGGYPTELTKNTVISDKFYTADASEFNYSRSSCLFNSAFNSVGELNGFTALDALRVAYQADGLRDCSKNHIKFHFKKERKIERILSLAKECGYETKITKSADESTNVWVYVEDATSFDKDLLWVKPHTRSVEWLHSFIRELRHWDGRFLTDAKVEVIEYFTTDLDNANIVQECAALSGLYSRLNNRGRKKDFHKDRYLVRISFRKNHICSSQIQKTIIPDYRGMVYCVEVPTNKIIVRRNGITSVQSNSRGGSGTHYLPFFNPEIITVLNLKNPMTPIAKRVRELDYGVSFNKWFLQKAAKNENVYLFSVKDNPELAESFYSKIDPMEWGKEMEAFAKSNPEKVQEIPAQEILKETLKQSLEVGRIYLHFVDEVNRHTPYKEKIYSSNLCSEIAIPSKPFKSYKDLYDTNIESDEMGVVGFCNLAGIVVDNIKDDEEYAKAAYYALSLIDAGIENADLGFPSLNESIRAYRSAGVGILGLAHLMASKGLSYASREGKAFMHELAETHAYHLYKAALQLGKERGNARFMWKTEFPEGWLPIDTYNKNVDEITPNNLKRDWEGLRKEIIDNKGIRFSTVSTIPPAESCIFLNQRIRTIDGDLSFVDIVERYTNFSLDEIYNNHEPLVGGSWYELNKPLKVLTASGEYEDCERIYYNGFVYPLEIELENGEILKVTNSHKFLINESNGESRWVAAIDLRAGMDIAEVKDDSR